MSAMTFLSWLGRTTKSSPWTYAAGDPALVLDVEEEVKRRTIAENYIYDSVTFYGGGLRWTDMRGEMRPLGLMNSIRMIIIREAEKVPLSFWAALAEYEATWGRRYRNTVPYTYVLVLSSEPFNAQDVKDPRYSPFVKGRYGQYVDCKTLNSDQRVTYVRRLIEPGRLGTLDKRELTLICEELVKRAVGPLAHLRAETKKVLSLLPPGAWPTKEDVQELVRSSSSDRFAEALVAEDNEAAIAAAPFVLNLRYALGRLDFETFALHLIYHAIRIKGRRVKSQDLGKYIGLDPFVVRRLRKSQKAYGPEATMRRYELLMQAYMRIPRCPADRPDWLLVPLARAW